MENVQINSDPEKETKVSSDENICNNELINNDSNINDKCNTNVDTSIEQLKIDTNEKSSIEVTSNSSIDVNQNIQNPTKYVPVRYSYSGSYFDKQFAEIEVQMNLLEVKNSLAKTCEILKEINFLESLRKGSKLSEKTLEFSEEIIDMDEVSNTSEPDHQTS
ncbi:hypothetical protein O3M35_001358 [Rhynocoris fuscipes]|uniref:Uncharacterized protein n=1 Tax=Rhynocoris fuscipes TaxID=488301 RepID=A0AAW1DQ09_9HEMI